MLGTTHTLFLASPLRLVHPLSSPPPPPRAQAPFMSGEEMRLQQLYNPNSVHDHHPYPPPPRAQLLKKDDEMGWTQARGTFCCLIIKESLVFM
jgi:hypothetical protein